MRRAYKTMDPIASTVLWGLAWLFGGSIGSAIIWTGCFGLVYLFGEVLNKEKLSMFFVVLGWLAVIGWQFFVIYQVIMHVVNLVQLTVAGG